MEVGEGSGSGGRKQVVLDLEDKGERIGGSLVGKVYTSKNLNIPTVISMIKKGWQLKEEMEVLELDRSGLVFLFHFRDMKEYSHILKGRPWSIQGFLLNLKVWDDSLVLKDVSFDEAPY
ncbi:hypothetical protein QN277_000596 [Acacia crassicarpa]|uniref:DUF4283 domain-containing protein n=1 Tax=Acacia crassicarpa TaxID=499986 RepID=A0AAE1THB1_9FABA|nr:hypothetical protein QN277_000596 [Acacia crassicarpa]